MEVVGTPRTTERNEEIRQERREQILDAALTVFCQKGYAAAEVADVAETAELARGLVYYYFQSKQGLFQALFAWMQERSYLIAREILLNSAMPPRDRLVLYARTLCQLTLHDERYSQFYMRMFQDMEHVYKGTTEDERENRFQIRHWMAEVIAQGMESGELRKGDSHLAANAYWGALSINLGELVRSPKRQAIEQDVIEEVISYCLNGIVKG